MPIMPCLAADDHATATNPKEERKKEEEATNFAELRTGSHNVTKLM